MPKICAIRNCKTGTTLVEEKRSLFRVPMDQEHRKKWEAAIPGKRELKSSQSICERHFLHQDVHKKWIKYDSGGTVIAEYEYPRPRLSAKAIPCIFKDEITPGPVDPWAIYKQQKDALMGNVLGSSNANAVSNEPEKPKTLQAVYFTGEHSYCRMVPTSEAGTSTEVAATAKQTCTDPPSTQNSPVIEPQKVVTDVSTVKKGSSDFMEVEALVDSLIDYKAPGEAAGSSEKSQRITLTTPAGKTQQLTMKTFGKAPQIRLVSNQGNLQKGNTATVKDKRESSIAKTEGKTESLTVVEPEVTEAADVDEGKKKASQLQFDTGGIFENGNKLVKLPYTWSLSELTTHEGKQIIFSHVIMVPHHNFGSPVLKKCVIIDENSGRINYYAHGRLVDISRTKLPQKVEDITSLQITLYTFQKMRLCGGLVPLTKSRETNKDVYQDSLQCWRHNDCPILVERGKCEFCAKLQKTLAQKRRRAEKSTGSMRISSSWDPRDQIVMLKKKLDMERKLRLHAQIRAEKLTEASKENGVKVTFVKNITL